jgi:transposase
MCAIQNAQKSMRQGIFSMKNRNNQRIEEITVTTLIVGIDIAKSVHWARFVDYRGKEIGKGISFQNTRQGFESIVAKIQEICGTKIKPKPLFDRIQIGMEPTGHYWKSLANYLIQAGYSVVGVNPYHTKKSKELDDNSPTKNDKKDALTIAKLVSNGRYFIPYLPEEEYGELRVLTNTRVSVMKRYSAVKNTITAILDEYFPEISTVFKKPLKGKASRQVLRSCPFPANIIELGEAGVLSEIKKAVKKSVGIKKVRQLIEAAAKSVGVEYGIQAAKLRIRMLIEELDQMDKHISEIELSMERAITGTGYSEQILSIKGIGIVTAASFFGEVGNPLRFQNARQIHNYSGYSLIEDSSGKSKSGTCISKRGRSQLRSLLYQMAFTMVGQNAEMKALYKYLTTRVKNPLKKKQALVVIAKKIVTVIYSLLKKQAVYDPALVLGANRREMMAAA